MLKNPQIAVVIEFDIIFNLYPGKSQFQKLLHEHGLKTTSTQI